MPSKNWHFVVEEQVLNGPETNAAANRPLARISFIGVADVNALLQVHK